MSALANLAFVNKQEPANEILVVDLRDGTPAPTETEARAIHESGLHFDQLMTVEPGRGTDISTRIFNNDGSEVSACGNGTRCVAWLVMQESGKDLLTINTKAGPLIATAGAEPQTVTVDMGAPRFGWQDIPLAEPFADTRAIELQIGPIEAPVLHSPSVVNVGNPHAIFWVGDVDAHDLGR